jgi:hypothetical protein
LTMLRGEGSRVKEKSVRISRTRSLAGCSCGAIEHRGKPPRLHPNETPDSMLIVYNIYYLARRKY